MADFGTVLNPLNDNLDLYCNSITCKKIINSESFYIHTTWFSGTNNTGIGENDIPYTINYPASNITNTSRLVYLDETKTKIVFPSDISLIGYYNIVVSGQQTILNSSDINEYSIILKDEDTTTVVNKWRFSYISSSLSGGCFYFNGQFRITNNGLEKELTIVSNTSLNNVLANMNVVITKFS